MAAESNGQVSAKSMAVYLDRHVDEADWHVTSIQADTPTFVSRLHLKDRPTLAQALLQELAQTLDADLADLPDRGLTVAPDRVVLVPGAAFVGIRLASRTTEDRTRVVVISFLRVLGNALAALHPDFRPELELQDEREILATEVLVDLIQPCLDIARAPDAVSLAEHRDHLLARLDALQAKSAELEFIAGLLTRLVARPEDWSHTAIPKSASQG